MSFQEIIVVVEIGCPGQIPIVKRIDVMQIAGPFDRGMVKTYVENNHPGCNVKIIDVEWVIDKRF